MGKHMTHWIVVGLVVASGCAFEGSATVARLGSPTIASIAPASAQPGTTVTITGTGFVGATVSIRGASASAVPVTATQAETIVGSTGTQIQLTIPDGSDAANGMMAPLGRDLLTVATPGGSVAAHFTVLPLRRTGKAPTISGFTPHRAFPGRMVTITGTHLSGATNIWLAGRKVKFQVPSDSEIRARVPMHARSGRWTVKTAVGTTVSAKGLTVLTPAN
jgi:hypothetical protein